MVNLPMSQGDLYLMVPLAWQHYRDQLPTFSGFRKYYTDQIAVNGLQLLADAMALDDDQARGAGPEMTRQQLVPQLTEYLDAWLRLDGYLWAAFGKAGYKPMREAAGADHYDAAVNQNWAEVTRLIASAKKFVVANAAALAANDNMPATFPALLASEAQDVTTLLERFGKQQVAAEQGTTLKEAANVAAYAAWQAVAADADRLFRRKPDTLKLFQTEYLLGIVSGTNQAGIRGTLTLADGTPAPGVTVEVKGVKDAVTTTDEDGRYALPVAAGTYVVGLSGAGYKPLDIEGVEVTAGVKTRVDKVVERA